MPRIDGIFGIEPDLAGAGLSIGVVMSRFNQPVCEGLFQACIEELLNLGVQRDDILVVTVAGALEIPLALKKIAETGEVQALVALGAVIRGETYHFEVVSDQSAAGILRVQLDSGIPVANGVLTVDTDEQAEARMSVKGAEAARVAVEMANLLQAIDDERD
ncbi:MAG: 6,7-dimethyl-8-ribityllumazine synthase [Burkholderiales bacterium]